MANTAIAQPKELEDPNLDPGNLGSAFGGEKGHRDAAEANGEQCQHHPVEESLQDSDLFGKSEESDPPGEPAVLGKTGDVVEMTRCPVEEWPSSAHSWMTYSPIDPRYEDAEAMGSYSPRLVAPSGHPASRKLRQLRLTAWW